MKKIIASLILTALSFNANANWTQRNERFMGGIMRGRPDTKAMSLIFTGGYFAEGADTILDALAKHNVKGNFFFTGNYLRNKAFENHIKRIVREGHYIGPHSDKHLLYCDWTPARKTLVSRDVFVRDLKANYNALKKFGVSFKEARYFVPPSEHYNQEIVNWSRDFKLEDSQEGVILINVTPGSNTHADHIGEANRGFVSSQNLYNRIWSYEKSEKYGLNGHMMLIHMGAGPKRKDKFHVYIEQIIQEIKNRGYSIVKVEDLLKAK